jgi:hypothetical protein
VFQGGAIGRHMCRQFAHWPSRPSVCKIMTDAEHPDGLLIDDAAKLHFPRLYTAWQEAWRQWSELGQGASYTVVKGKLINSELYHPYLVAAVVAGEALKSACRREFAKPDWVVTCLEGRARVPIDGDFLREAELNLRERSALGGAIRNRTLVTALRVRRAAGLRKQDEAIAATTPADARAQNPSPVIQRATYSERAKFFAKKPPDQFMKWAKGERHSGRIITQSNARDAMEEIFGLPPNGPSGRIVIAWCRSLRPEWIAKRGTPPSRSRA